MKKNSKLLTNLLSLFYPKICIGCKKILQENEDYLCLECLLHLPETNYHLLHENPLEKIFWGRVKVEKVFCFLFYRKGNYVQSLLHELKYKGNKEIGAYLSAIYGNKLKESHSLEDIDLILPIPLHPKKLKLRGYNQSEWIAKGLSKTTGLPYSTQYLTRETFTETQTQKSRFNRWENVKNVFKIQNEEDLTGKHILICDDVLTTGATMEAAIHKVLSVPNSKVSVLTLATAQD